MTNILYKKWERSHELGSQLEKHIGQCIASRLAQKMAPAIVRTELILTEACSLHCDYCFVAEKKAERRMPWEIARNAIDFLLKESRDRTEVNITFFGGEPLLEFSLMKRISEYSKRAASTLGKKVTYTVTTNGICMNREIALFGREYSFNYLLSIDGEREAHNLHRKTFNGEGSWDTVMGANFYLLKSIQEWMGARVTVNPDTVDHLSAGIKMLFEMGVNQFIIGPNTDIEWSHETMEILGDELLKVADFYIEETKKGSPIRISDFEETLPDRKSKFASMWGCDACRSRIAVSTQGDIYPCARFVSTFSDINGKYRLGNLDEGINNISARQEFMDNSDSPRPKCASCSYRDYCSGGCPATNLHMQGSIYQPSELDCHMTRIKVEILNKIEKSRMKSVTKIEDKLPLSNK